MNSITHGVCTYCHLKSSLHHSNFLIAGAVYPVWNVEKTRPQDVVYKQVYNLFIAWFRAVNVAVCSTPQFVKPMNPISLLLDVHAVRSYHGLF